MPEPTGHRPDQVPDEGSDADLLAAHVAGDPDAFGVLVARHRDRLWGVALRTAGDREVAADALQDGLVSAFRRAATFRGDAQVTTWLHRVVVNACLDRLRAAAVRRTEALPDDPVGADALLARGTHETPRRPPDPETHALDVDRRRAVVAALAELSPEQRAAVVLVDMEGYPVAEAARMLDCPVGTVKSRCARARARLAVVLAPLLLDDEVAPVTTEAGNRPGSASVPSTGGRGPPVAPARPTTRPTSTPTTSPRQDP